MCVRKRVARRSSSVQIGIGMAWCWLSNMLNMPPRRLSLVVLDVCDGGVDTCDTDAERCLMQTFFHVLGHDIARTYPKQVRVIGLHSQIVLMSLVRSSPSWCCTSDRTTCHCCQRASTSIR
jgi:hypothetical protein